jgi:hypothetical protein
MQGVYPAEYSNRGAAMGKRDYRHREPKKTKKETRKILADTEVLPTSTAVEVIKKRKKEETKE